MEAKRERNGMIAVLPYALKAEEFFFEARGYKNNINF